MWNETKPAALAAVKKWDSKGGKSHWEQQPQPRIAKYGKIMGSERRHFAQKGILLYPTTFHKNDVGQSENDDGSTQAQSDACNLDDY